MSDLTKQLEQALKAKEKRELRCPVCDSKGTDILRNMDGSTWCINCKHEGSAQEFTRYVEELNSALLKCVEALDVAHDYLEDTVDCGNSYCDPDVNWHTPYCCMESSFGTALADLREALEGGK